jgi:hypothetical protein
LRGGSWAKWRVLLIAAMGEELNSNERAIFMALTGRERGPLNRVEELWAIMGRRSGKTRAIAVLGAYLAALCDFTDVLAPGERAILPILSASLWQAGKAFQYLDGIFDNVPALKKLVIGQTADTISLATRVDIECRPASFRTIRSGTAVAIIGDEVAFWRSDDSANPDTEILNAGRPSLATTGGILAVISSPYAKKGEVFATFKRDFGPNGDPAILVAKAASRDMNPTLTGKVIARAYERDPASASAEYGGEFRADIETFVSREVVEACIQPGCFERPYVFGDQRGALHHQYFAFVDFASGSGRDSAALAIAHKEGDIAVLDCLREIRPPFSPQAAVAEFVGIAKRYQLIKVTGDRWAPGFVAEGFGRHGFGYEVSERTKSDCYRELLPLMNARRVELLDSPRLLAQLCSLERRVARSGRDSIDAEQGAPEDLANAAAGALVIASGVHSGFDINVYIRAYG